MIGCVRNYAEATGESGHIIDEAVVMRTYTMIIGDLYHKVKFADLPAVQSHEVSLLSKLFSRKSKDDIPQSNAKTWVDLRKDADGNSCISVIESIFTAAKMVPESMLHPISRLMMVMDQPVVVDTPKGPKFAIPKDKRIAMTPTGIERLKVYVNHKLNGNDGVTTVNKMTAVIKDTEIFDSRNLYKGR